MKKMRQVSGITRETAGWIITSLQLAQFLLSLTTHESLHHLRGIRFFYVSDARKMKSIAPIGWKPLEDLPHKRIQVQSVEIVPENYGNKPVNLS